MPTGMHPYSPLLILCILISANGFSSLTAVALAGKLSDSGHGSTLQPHCDLCWSPSMRETNPLPSTLQPHRQHHPSGSRPHRLPKGHYKIAPSQRQSQPSILGRMARTRIPMSQPIYTIDGDTVRIGQDRIRLRGIDTPELSEPGGQAARQRLEQLLQEGPIKIVPHGQDVYGRTIADVFVNGKNVAEVLKNEGFVKP